MSRVSEILRELFRNPAFWVGYQGGLIFHKSLGANFPWLFVFHPIMLLLIFAAFTHIRNRP